jgi:hypothetical protein
MCVCVYVCVYVPAVCMWQDAGVDYILYPVFNRLPTLMDPPPGEPINMPFTYLSASTRMPALTFPVGYAETDGVPIALSLTGPRYSEGELISLAFGYEQQVFASMYHATDLYPPLSESDGDGDDDEVNTILIVVISIGCLGIVAGSVLYYFFKPRITDNTELDRPLL